MIKSFMSVEMFSRMHQYEANAAMTIAAWREFFSVHSRNLVLLCVCRIMNNSVDAGLLTELARFKLLALICSHGKSRSEQEFDCLDLCASLRAWCVLKDALI